MILTNCAACAAPLAHNAPRCVRCWTRYCDATCQHDHWRRGHKQMCKKIHRGGNAEQYYADKKYKESVAVAAEACAEDTKGQTCYICTQALHWKTKEGLVRGCACRGTAGFAHVSCLAEQAKILLAEAEENNLDVKVQSERWVRWYKCSLCEQRYYGVVLCALGWACWKTYVDRPETDTARRSAMTQLGNGLSEAGQHEDELTVGEAELSMERRLGAPEARILDVQNNLATTYSMLGRREEAVSLQRDVHSGKIRLFGGSSKEAIIAAQNLVDTLMKLGHHEEALPLLLETIPKSQRVLGKDHEQTFKLQRMHAQILIGKDCASLDDLSLVVATLEDLDRRQRRTQGPDHPQRKMTQVCLDFARKRALLARKRALVRAL
ncbi:unnamed protein product [Pelagomonas calceolata]|uniref:MYND-type domain-containing protein n=1 Tax=Pelagomonas calceolata TaxID=35677 RepID=A0A8J2WMS5_9STRA|nr:unnamed protein product [Pelagomonas calceolata]